MRQRDRQELNKRVVHFYLNIANRDKNKTVSHFRAEGYKTRGLYYMIERYEKRGSDQFLRKSGRPVTLSTPQNIRKVKRLLLNTNTSIRDAAKKTRMSARNVLKIKQRLNIKTKKCKKVPKYSGNQRKRAKKNCRKVYRKSIGKVLIIDDETYVKVDPKANYGNRYYHYIDENKVSESIKLTGIKKFGEKYLVWQAIDEFGHVSEPYIKVGTLTAKEYLSECIVKRLYPFIQKYHKNSLVLFWPDLARIHYSNDVKNWFECNDIEMVSMEENPPSVPNARPIERYWNIMKGLYSKIPREPKSLRGFTNTWVNISKVVQEKYAKNLMVNVRRILRLIGEKGVYADVM